MIAGKGRFRAHGDVAVEDLGRRVEKLEGEIQRLVNDRPR
jgi:hypothetical protein